MSGEFERCAAGEVLVVDGRTAAFTRSALESIEQVRGVGADAACAGWTDSSRLYVSCGMAQLREQRATLERQRASVAAQFAPGQLQKLTQEHQELLRSGALYSVAPPGGKPQG